MIPVLYKSTDTSFTSMGIGALSEAVSCTVQEKINGIYELDLKYPVGARHARELAPDRIITAPNNDQDSAQPFRIYSIRPSLSGRMIQVRAAHISYQLNHIPVAPFSGTTAALAIANLGNNTVGTCPFQFAANVEDKRGYTASIPTMARTALKAMADYYKGELEFDHYNVRLLGSRGQDNGVTIAYGKNLATLEQEISITNVVDAICGYWAKDGVVVMGGVVSGPTQYSYKRTKLVDMTSMFDTEPTVAQLGEMADMAHDTELVSALVSMQLGFVPLWQTAQYRRTAPYERVRLGDTVTVRCAPMGIDSKVRITGLVYDVLRGRFTDVQVGSPRQTLDRTLADIVRKTGR